jgi:hypothetical protein
VLALVLLATALPGPGSRLGKSGLANSRLANSRLGLGGIVIGGSGIAKYGGNICAKGSQEKRLQGLGAPQSRGATSVETDSLADERRELRGVYRAR